jgi:hypothetical protein
MKTLLPIVNRDGKKANAILIAEEDPDAFVELQSDFYNSGKIPCEILYDGFQLLHRQLDGLDIKLLCQGYRYDVRPSGMALDMGHGILAYIMKLGRPATELVNIFDSTDNVADIVSYNEQQSYFGKWIDSLRS